MPRLPVCRACRARGLAAPACRRPRWRRRTTQPPARERIEIRGAGGRSDVEGDDPRRGPRRRAAPGTRRPALRTGAARRDRRAAAARRCPRGGEPRELGQRILAELPAGFERPRHQALRRVLRHLARLRQVVRGPLRAAPRRLRQLLAQGGPRDRRSAAAARRGDLRRPPGGTRPMPPAISAPPPTAWSATTTCSSNRVTTFDLTGTRRLPRAGPVAPGRAGLEILASPAAAGLVSTLVHEATHQMAFNCGMHRRLAPVPLWVSEGDRRPTSRPRPGSDPWLAGHRRRQPPAARPLPGRPPARRPRGDRRRRRPFRRADGPLDAYAAAWALTWHLLQTRKESFVAYMRTLAAKEPLAADSPAGTVARTSEAAFGVSPGDLEEPVAKAMARLATQPR